MARFQAHSGLSRITCDRSHDTNDKSQISPSTHTQPLRACISTSRTLRAEEDNLENQIDPRTAIEADLLEIARYIYTTTIHNHQSLSSNTISQHPQPPHSRLPPGARCASSPPTQCPSSISRPPPPHTHPRHPGLQSPNAFLQRAQS